MIRIIAGGKKNRAWLAEACGEYEKRLRRPYGLSWQLVDEAELEAKVTALSRDVLVVLLDERGELLTSPELAERLESAFEAGREVAFVLGGAFGHFSPALQARANLVLSLSKMVLPHQLCRLVLVEQLYRAQEINLGRPYHHA